MNILIHNVRLIALLFVSLSTPAWSGTVFLYDARAEESAWEGVLQRPYIYAPPQKFGCGEQRVKLDLPTPLPEHMTIVGSIPDNDTLMHTMLVANALKGAGTQHITAVIPYLAYMRQDRPKLGEPASAALVIRALEEQIDQFVTLDLHSERNRVCFTKPLICMSACALFAKKIEKFADALHEKIIVSPDEGGILRATHLSLCFQEQPQVIELYKERTESGVKTLPLSGDVDVMGKTCFVVDDMIDSGGTLLETCQALKRAGAFAVHAFCTHGIFSSAFFRNFPHAALDTLTVTNSLPAAAHIGGVEIISWAPLLKGVLDLSSNMS